MTEFLAPEALREPIHLDERVPVPVTDDYMIAPVETSFNWQAYFSQVDAGQWYLVVFRSKHHPEADEAFLNDLDHQASEAARQTPGFICYFIGTPRSTGECLSFCLWRDRTSARAGSSHPAHRRAIEQGMSAFEHYTLERYLIEKIPGQNRLAFFNLSV